MATTLTNTTFLTTYKDDFRDSDGYHRILFNSGKALQARELTQIQTFLQTQISRFGDNVFKEGAVVKPGGANLNQKYEFIKLDTTTNALPTDTSTLVNATFTGASSSIAFKVLQVVAATGSDPATLYVQYTNTSSGTAGATTIRVTAGENITGSGSASGTTLTVQTTNTSSNPAVGVGILATLKSGVYYARGHFVFTEDQSKIISKYSDNVDTNLGFKVVEDIVTTTDDNDLFDNQGAVPDISAPGADRYRIQLTIAEQTDIDSDENFILVAVVQKGVIFQAVDTNNAYNIPNDVVAKRIFENSGDYTVKPFIAKFEEDSENTHLILKVSDGVVVVDGYRAARNFPTNIRILKPSATADINNDVIGVNYENSVLVNPNVDSNTQSLPNISTYEKLTLKDDSDFKAGSNTIGTARVKAINTEGINLKYHLFDVQMNAGQAFRNVKSIGTSINNYFNPVLEQSKAVLKKPAINTSLFALPRQRAKALTDISFAVQRLFTATTNGSGQASLSLSAAGETFTNTDDWIIGSDSGVISPSTIHADPTFGAAGSTSIAISGLPHSTAIKVLAYVNKSQATVKTKTLTTRTASFAPDSDISLGKADIFDVSEIVKHNDSSVSFASRFKLDNGQRDNFYGVGRLILRSGQSVPSDSCSVTYRYFEHGVSGDFFAVNSYTGQVDYDQIPTHTFSNGHTARLRDFADFRPVKDGVDSEFSNSGQGARHIELPQTGTLITSDNSYYLPVAGKIVIDREGIIRFIRGQHAFEPQVPTKPDQTLALFDVRLNGNTDNDSDLSIKKIEHKRFTMKDIGNLEKRVSRVEEATTLSLLQIDTKYFQVLDSSGVDRTKSGFMVDEFKDHAFTNLSTSQSNRSAIDPLQKIMRPAFQENNIRLIYDSASSTNTIKKGDNVYIAHDETPYINQNLATKSIVINPFAVAIYEGVATLSPASDEWRDVDRNQDRIIQGGSRLSTKNAFNWNNWSWNWCGIPVDQLQVGSGTNVNNNIIHRVVAEETVLDLVEDRVLQTAFLPFMRSRKVFFKAEGLRPNTRVFPFLDGNEISAFTRAESFQFYADADSDFGNTLKNTTAHPDGSSTLTTDANGTITGSFIVPNNNSIKIRVGTKEFKILDISADNEEGAACIAKAPYTAQGFLDTKEATYATTRLLHVQGFDIARQRLYHGDDGGDPDPDGDKGGSVTQYSPETQTGQGGSWGFTGPESNSITQGIVDTFGFTDMTAFSHDVQGYGTGGGQRSNENGSSNSPSNNNTNTTDTSGGFDDGKSVICTALNDIYGFGTFRNKIWMKYNNYENAKWPSTSNSIAELGYHKIFGPLSEKMKYSKTLTKVLRRIARVRTDRIRKEMSNKPYSLESKIHLALIRPFALVAGWLVHKGILNKYEIKSKRKGI